MKRKYREDYDENKQECIQYAKAHLDILHYKEIMGSYSRMTVCNIIAFVISFIVLFVTFAYIIIAKIDSNLGVTVFLLAWGKALLFMAALGIIVCVISSIVSNIVDHTVGRKWFQYYMAWYDAYH